MSLWVLIALALMGVSAVIVLIAIIMGIIQGFKVHPAWGIANILGICLFLLPQIIFSLAKLDERWPLLIMVLGGLIPLAIGATMLFFEQFLAG